MGTFQRINTKIDPFGDAYAASVPAFSQSITKFYILYIPADPDLLPDGLPSLDRRL
ncbi:MAG: hypothetical protein IGR76_14250 [Synechococcales cyanobacterium T60_A2020_003]|nr:hypothetical protein [Synechococcales cyanobacterium T60_A2020_003]